MGQVPKRDLGATGLKVPILSFGAAPLGSVYGDVSEDECRAAVRTAFEAGINYFDTAPYYGDTKSETVLGRCLRDLPRDQILVATKVGRYGLEPKDFDFSAGRVQASVRASLQRLGLQYLDVVHVHDIEFGDLDQIARETLPALQELRREGLLRHIGITGLPLRPFTTVLARAPPGVVDLVLSYCHHTLADDTLLGLLPALRQARVGLINASALGMGLLTEQGPPEWHLAPPELKKTCAAAAQHAKQRGVSLARLAVHFATANPDIPTTLVGFKTPEQVVEGVRAATTPLTPLEQEVLREVQGILAPVKDMTWPSGRPENS